MTVSYEPIDPRAVLASDGDREAVTRMVNDAMARGQLTVAEADQRLRTLAEVRTVAELEPLTHDLHAFVGSSAGPRTEVIPGAVGPAESTAILSGVTRERQWTMPRHHKVVSILGGVHLDLTEVVFAAPVVTIAITAVVGGVDIRVPGHVTVEVVGTGVLGAFTDRTTRAGVPGAPVVRVTGIAVLAGVEITGVD